MEEVKKSKLKPRMKLNTVTPTRIRVSVCLSEEDLELVRGAAEDFYSGNLGWFMREAATSAAMKLKLKGSSK